MRNKKTLKPQTPAAQSQESPDPREAGDLLIRSAVTAAHGKDTLTVEITFEPRREYLNERVRYLANFRIKLYLEYIYRFKGKYRLAQVVRACNRWFQLGRKGGLRAAVSRVQIFRV